MTPGMVRGDSDIAPPVTSIVSTSPTIILFHQPQKHYHIMPSSTILITGGAGFVGQALASALLSSSPSINLLLTDIVEPPTPTADPSKKRTTCTQADLSDPKTLASVLSQKFSAAYILHGIMSGASESNMELGYKVNLDSTRLIFDNLRNTQPGLVVVYTSSTAVYGPPEAQDQIYTEQTLPAPQSSYGTQKFMIECLLNDYARRGLLDARIVRLPTVTIRAGKPTGAASSFASGILREPLQGMQSELPVRKDLKLWVCSPGVVVANLVKAKDVPKSAFEGRSRTVNLPGRTVTVQEMLDALEEVGGKEARGLVVDKVDAATEKIVESWPTEFDTRVAAGMGYIADVSLLENLRLYKESIGQS